MFTFWIILGRLKDKKSTFLEIGTVFVQMINISRNLRDLIDFVYFLYFLLNLSKINEKSKISI